MKENIESDFTELRGLLRSEEDQVPHYDFGDGFLGDFHNRLRSDSLSSQPSSRFAQLIEMPNILWGSAVAAAVVLGVCLGLFYDNGKTPEELVNKNYSSTESIVYVNAEGVDTSGIVSTYISKPLEF